MIGVLIRGVIRLVTKPQADKLVSRGIAQKIPTRGQDAAQVAGKKVGTKEFNKLVRTRPPKVVKPKVVKPKVVKPKSTIAGTKTKPVKPSPWKKSSKKEPSASVKHDFVKRGPKVTGANAKSGNIVTRGGKRAGTIVAQGGKKFIKTKTGKLIAIGSAGAAGYYLGKAIDKSIAGTSGAATTTKPPKPSKPVTTAPAPPSQLPSSPNGKKPKPQQSGPSGGPPQRSAIKAKPKSYEQKLKDKFIKDRGGIDAFKPTTKWGKYWKGDKSGKDIADSAWSSHLLNMREGHEAGLTFTDQQKYDKVMAERKELSKKKRGGVIKRKRGGVVRGVGKALRGYGKASYSNKMY